MKKLICFLLVACAAFHSAKAQLASYSYISPITVYNTASTAITDYQLKMTINTQSIIAASQMQANGNDIRFGKTCNGSTLYNYWIESGINTATTVIWVRIDTIPASGSRTIYLFSGNAAASAGSSVPLTFNGARSATDSVNTGAPGGVGNSQRGFRFSPNEDILVTDFGKDEPTGTMRYVTLFDYTSTNILAQTQVSGPAGTYTYAPLSNPMWLTQGTQYVLELYQGASDGYYFGNSSQINPKLTYYDMLYCNSCTQNTFPTNSLTNYHYGYPDLLFYYKNNFSPTPNYSVGVVAPVSVAQSATAACASSPVTFTASSSSVMSYTWQPGALTGSVVTVMPASSTIYTVSGMESGCTVAHTATLSVTTNPSPTVNISGASAICSGQSATLTANGAVTYSWSTSSTSSSITVTPSNTATYSVTGQGSNGCNSTTAITVSVNALPTLSVTTSNTLLCAGQSATLTASGANSYSWMPSGSGASIVVSPTTTATYTAMGTNTTTGCSNSAMLTQSVSACTAVENLSGADHALSIFPNPSNGKFSIHLDNDAQVEICNLLGETVFTQSLKKGSTEIHLSETSKGTYFVKVSFADRQSIRRIIIQ